MMRWAAEPNKGHQRALMKNGDEVEYKPRFADCVGAAVVLYKPR
jgi:hypothetical protein